MNTPRFPVAAGHWTVQGRRLRCRLPRRTVEVDAPAPLLRSLEAACDGRRPWRDVAPSLRARWGARDVDAFVARLYAEGVVVESGRELMSLAELGWWSSPMPRALDAGGLGAQRLALQAELDAPPPAVTHPPGASALGRLLTQRRTPVTFAEASLPLQALVDMLWAAHGVTDRRDGVAGRTVPSAGGLHALVWHLALLKPNASYAAGLYRVRFHASDAACGHVSLQRLPGDANGAWATLSSPAVLSHASAVLYPAARLEPIVAKYANRALMFAHIELGHAAQNVALAAVEAGAGAASRGDTVEPEVQRLFALPAGEHPLPALVLGTLPSETERAQAASSLPVTTQASAVCPLRLGGTSAKAGPIVVPAEPDRQVFGHGRSLDARVAAIKAEAEAWERAAWSSVTALVEAAERDLPAAVSPGTLVAYDAGQYQRASFPFRRHDPARVAWWCAGHDVVTGGAAYLLSSCVLSAAALPERARESLYTGSTTSGMAAWSSAAGAIARAAGELVERDAFVRAWLRQAPPPRLPDAAISANHLQRLDALREAGYEVVPRWLPSPWLPVAGVSLRRRLDGAKSFTTGTGAALEDALEAALCEAEGNAQDLHGRVAAADIPARDIRSAQQHGQFHRSRRGAAAAAGFFAPGETADLAALAGLASPRCASLDTLVERLAARGRRVYACDLTPPGASLIQGRAPLHVWRAFVPGLLPLWFGHGLEPWGLVDALNVDHCAELRRRRTPHPYT